jgi:hypothetical protein
LKSCFLFCFFKKQSHLDDDCCGDMHFTSVD